MATFSSTLMCGKSPMPWKTYPIRRRSVAGSLAATGSPSMRTVPLSGSISRLMNFRVVVLPEPDAPTSATKRPSSTCSVTSWTANVRPSSNDLQSLSSSMNGAMLKRLPGCHVIPCCRGRVPATGARWVVQWLCLTYLAAIFINTPGQHPVEARRLASCGRHYLLAFCHRARSRPAARAFPGAGSLTCAVRRAPQRVDAPHHIQYEPAPGAAAVPTPCADLESQNHENSRVSE